MDRADQAGLSTDGHTSGAAPASIDLPTWLGAVMAIDPSADALHFEGEWRPWAWMSRASSELDRLLNDAGHGVDTMVGVVMRNRPEIVRTISASLSTRRCLVTLSSAVPLAQLVAEIGRLRLPVVVANRLDWAKSEFAAAVRDAGSFGLLAEDGDLAFRPMCVPGTRVGAADVAPGVAVQMLTSGTTGLPKRIDLLYRSLEHEIESTAHYSASASLAAPRLSSGVALVWNPVLHIGGLRGLLTSLVAGRKVALLERFSVDGWAAMVREHRPRVISLVPAAMAMVLAADLPADTFRGIEALFSGTAPLDPRMAREFEERYGVPVLVVYGATEFAGGVAGWTIADWRAHRDDKIGSVGRPNNGIDVRVVSRDTGVELPRGQQGLLEVKGPQLGGPGWTRTTDLARVDEDDFIWIDGRADDVIVRGGYKVATGEVRTVLVDHPSVLDACVIGIEDRRLGQVPVAAVELRPDAAPVLPDELLTWTRERMSGYQVPVHLQIVDSLPRTPSMKVSQGEVRQLFLAQETTPR